MTPINIKQVFFDHLVRGGLDGCLVPGYVNLLLGSLRNDPMMPFSQLTRRIAYLGWQGYEIDYHTYQLALSYFEASGLIEAKDFYR